MGDGEYFEGTVQDCLDSGWSLQGGVSMSAPPMSREIYAQAMIKESE